ncbi:hypothetical protein DXG01_010177 [Tephrocybe rancida]|nr:hypothetical protein DXG01_010177 [Tephrocybe rancida]
MAPNWEPGTAYATGDVVVYEGATYKIIQPHRSQSDWAPSVTPALWGRIPGQSVGDHHEQPAHHQQVYQQPPTEQSPPTYQHHDDGAQLQQGYNHQSDQKPQPPSHEPEKKTHWYDDKAKLGLALGGGIALAGGIHHLVKKHEEKEDEEEGRIAWVNEARARTDLYNREGPRGSASWILTQGKNFPAYAITVGEEHSQPLYICRAYHDGGKQVGAASGALKLGAVFGYKHKEHHRDIYEILLGDMHGLRWVPARGKVNVSALGYSPVEGGHEHNGTPLYIIKALYGGGYHPGKASATLDGAYIPIDGTEKNIKEYEVLCYNS